MSWFRRITTLLAALIVTAGCASNRPEGLAAMLEKGMQEAVRQDGFSGSVLVAVKGKVVLHRAYGTIDGRPESAPMTTATVFDIGSLTKQFTAAAILRLVDHGQIDLEHSVARYFPDAPADKASITIRQLLTHTSGLTDHSNDDWEVLTKEAALQRIFAQKLVSPPGREFHYSNSGYTVLAAVIEHATATAYPQYMLHSLFRPFRLTHTGFYDSYGRWKHASVSHGIFAGIDRGALSSWPGPYWGPMGNGEILSTTGDLYRWMTAIRGLEVLSRATTRRMFEPQARITETASYGFGWGIKCDPSYTLITHGGAGLGGNADIGYYLERQVLIIVLSNQFWPDWAKEGTEARNGRAARPALNLRETLWEIIHDQTPV